jgi:hypothetical protein
MSKLTHRSALEALRRQYFWLDSHFDELYALCFSTDEKVALRAAWAGSRDNLRDAQLRVFIDKDPTAEFLLAELQETMERAETSLASGNPEGLISFLNAAVSTGSRLIACGSSGL